MVSDSSRKHTSRLIIDHMLNKKYRVAVVVFKIMLIIAVIELFIMFLLSFVHFSEIKEGILDAIFLLLVSSPLIYIFVIKPYVDANINLIAYISEIAIRDPLTNLWNTRALIENLKSYFSENIRRCTYGALLFLDLNKFKQINDTYGHDCGDFVLIEIAKRINKATRAEDAAYRIGGDEFLVLFKFFDSEKNRCREKTLQAATRILNEIRMPMCFGEQEFVMSTSIGVCIIPPIECIPDNIIKYADLAMYHAKKSADGDIIFYDDL